MGRRVPTANTPKTVLIVEDDDAILHVAQMALSRVGGWRTLTARDGLAAVEVAAAERPDVILLDVMLPQLDGPATLRALRGRPETEDIPVVFMTARVQPHERNHYAALGAAGVIPKPFDPMTLPDQIAALLGRRAPPPDRSGRSALLEQALRKLPERVRELVRAVQYALGSPSPEATRQAIRIAHKLAGFAGTIGAPELGQLAGELEASLREGDVDAAEATLARVQERLS